MHKLSIGGIVVLVVLLNLACESEVVPTATLPPTPTNTPTATPTPTPTATPTPSPPHPLSDPIEVILWMIEPVRDVLQEAESVEELTGLLAGLTAQQGSLERETVVILCEIDMGYYGPDLTLEHLTENLQFQAGIREFCAIL